MSEPFIRYRTRRGYIKEQQAYGTWEECQVVLGRKVLFRCDLTHQAEAFITDMKKKDVGE